MLETRPYTTVERGWLSLLAVSTLVFSWLGMQVGHELGHVLHAKWSGGTVVRVVLHPLEISRTDVHPNPHPQFVAWGGPVWGCLIPLAGGLLLFALGLNSAHFGRFFAGFCFLANGAYIGAGVFLPVGDAEDLLRHGAPVWSLGAFGIIALLAAAYSFNGWSFWNLFRQKSSGHGDLATRRGALTMTALAAIVIVLELAFYQTTP
ncbi:MAG: hypothetical protein AB7O26_17035 [Planctomycetaceae bacterium]